MRVVPTVLRRPSKSTKVFSSCNYHLQLGSRTWAPPHPNTILVLPRLWKRKTLLRLVDLHVTSASSRFSQMRGSSKHTKGMKHLIPVWSGTTQIRYNHSHQLFIDYSIKYMYTCHTHISYIYICKDILGSYTYVGAVSAQARSLFSLAFESTEKYWNGCSIHTHI